MLDSYVSVKTWNWKERKHPVYLSSRVVHLSNSLFSPIEVIVFPITIRCLTSARCLSAAVPEASLFHRIQSRGSNGRRQSRYQLSWTPTAWSTVCDSHFKPDDFKNSIRAEEPVKKRRSVLKSTAVPSIFTWSAVDPTLL